MDKNFETEYGARFIIDEQGLHFSKTDMEIEMICDCLDIMYYSTDNSYFVEHKDAYELIRRTAEHHDITII